MGANFQSAGQAIVPALAELDDKLRQFVTNQYLKTGQQVPPSLAQLVSDVGKMGARVRGWQPGAGTFLDDPANVRELVNQILGLSARTAQYTYQSPELGSHLSEVQSALDSVMYFFTSEE